MSRSRKYYVVSKATYFLVGLAALTIGYTNCGPFTGSSHNGDDFFTSQGSASFTKAAVINEAELRKSTKISESGMTRVFCDNPNKELAENRASSLTQLEVRNSLRAILGIEVDASVYSLVEETSLVDFSNTHYASLEVLAKQSSAKFIASLDNNENPFWTCDLSSPCVEKILTKLPTLLWRRPPMISESQTIKSLISGLNSNSKDDNRNRLTTLIDFLITAPQFHIKNAMVDTQSPISKINDVYEMASRLSFALLYSAPDYRLMQGINGGTISSVYEVKDYFLSQLNQEYFQKQFVLNFFGKWLGFASALADKSKFGGVPVNEAGQREYNRILKIFQNNQPLQHIVYNADGFGIMHSKIFAKATYSEIAEGEVENTNLVQRGLYVMTNLLCMSTPGELNPALESEISEIENSEGFPKNGTNIEKAEFHGRVKVCASCHEHIDYLAIGAEPIGPFGEIRKTYPGGQMIDLSTDPRTNAPYVLGGLSYNSMDSYSHLVANSVDFKSCFTKKIHRRLLPTPKKGAKPCLITNIFQSPNIGLKDLISNFISSDIVNLKRRPAFDGGE